MEKYHQFQIFVDAGIDGESAAIVSGLWWGDGVPTPAMVRNRIKSAIAPWFATPDGMAALAKYSEFDLGDLDANFYPPLEELIRAAGIIDLRITIVEAYSDWTFTDALHPGKND